MSFSSSTRGTRRRRPTPRHGETLGPAGSKEALGHDHAQHRLRLLDRGRTPPSPCRGVVNAPTNTTIVIRKQRMGGVISPQVDLRSSAMAPETGPAVGPPTRSSYPLRPQTSGLERGTGRAELQPVPLGVRLSPASFSAIERSFAGAGPRQFDADEIVAVTHPRLPIGWFLTPPPVFEEVTIQTPDSGSHRLPPRCCSSMASSEHRKPSLNGNRSSRAGPAAPARHADLRRRPHRGPRPRRTRRPRPHQRSTTLRCRRALRDAREGQGSPPRRRRPPRRT